MAFPMRFDLRVVPGAALAQPLQLSTQAGGPFDLTAAVLVAEARRTSRPSATELLELTVAPEGEPTAGLVMVTASAEQTATVARSGWWTIHVNGQPVLYGQVLLHRSVVASS